MTIYSFPVRNRITQPAESTNSMLANKPTLQRIPNKPAIDSPLTLQSSTTIKHKPPNLRNARSQTPPSKQTSPIRQMSPQSSPTKSTSPRKSHSDIMRPNFPQKSPSPPKLLLTHKPPPAQSKPSSPNSVSGSPQPRIFGSSTFYIPPTDSSSMGKSKPEQPTGIVSRAPKQNTITPLYTKNIHFNKSASNISSNGGKVTTNFKNKIAHASPSNINGKVDILSSTDKHKDSNNAAITAPSSITSPIRADYVNMRLKSQSPVSGHSQDSSRETSVSSDAATIYMLKSASSRETSAESEASVILKKGIGTASGSVTSKSSPEGGGSCERKSPEKRKIRSGSSDDTKGKEKRRSCDLDSSMTDEQLKKNVSLKTGKF